jgi:hypothetical protein
MQAHNPLTLLQGCYAAALQCLFQPPLFYGFLRIREQAKQKAKVADGFEERRVGNEVTLKETYLLGSGSVINNCIVGLDSLRWLTGARWDSGEA